MHFKQKFHPTKRTRFPESSIWSILNAQYIYNSLVTYRKTLVHCGIGIYNLCPERPNKKSSIEIEKNEEHYNFNPSLFYRRTCTQPFQTPRAQAHSGNLLLVKFLLLAGVLELWNANHWWYTGTFYKVVRDRFNKTSLKLITNNTANQYILFFS